MGAGPPGVLLEGGRGEREAERHHHARVQRDLGRPREPRRLGAARRLRAGGPESRRGDNHARHLSLMPWGGQGAPPRPPPPPPPAPRSPAPRRAGGRLPPPARPGPPHAFPPPASSPRRRAEGASAPL